MSRIPRQRLGHGVYHVYNRANDRKWIFDSDQDKRKFLELLTRFSERFAINTYHWVIMSNHFHLAVEVIDQRKLSSWMSKACSRYSVYYHKTHGGTGRLWEDRFKTILIQKSGYLCQLGRYIERNPLRAQITGIENAWDYGWSSARSFCCKEDDPLVDKKSCFFWQEMGDNDDVRRNVYRQYLLDEREREIEENLFRSSKKAIGDKVFLGNVDWQYGRIGARKVGRPRSVIK